MYWRISARATSAAFPHFKIFKKPGADRDLCDGGFYLNCPVEVASKESQLIWSDLGDLAPDIFLSLGTGYDPDPKKGKPALHPQAGRHGNIFREGKTFTVALLQTIKDCQATWRGFVGKTTERFRGNSELESRYIRLDVALPGKVPELDELDKVGQLEKYVEGWVPQAKEVAHRLVASCFYLKLQTIDPEKEGGQGQGHRIAGEFSFTEMR